MFEGTKDSSADTLRQVKVIFLTELELPVERAQEILQNAPAAIRTGASADELEPFRKRLERAGAKVMIVSPAGAHPVDDQNESAEELPGASMEFSFELSDSEFKTPGSEGKKKSKKIYKLELDDSEIPTVSANTLVDANERTVDRKPTLEPAANDSNTLETEAKVEADDPQVVDLTNMATGPNVNSGGSSPDLDAINESLLEMQGVTALAEEVQKQAADKEALATKHNQSNLDSALSFDEPGTQYCLTENSVQAPPSQAIAKIDLDFDSGDSATVASESAANKELNEKTAKDRAAKESAAAELAASTLAFDSLEPQPAPPEESYKPVISPKQEQWQSDAEPIFNEDTNIITSELDLSTQNEQDLESDAEESKLGGMLKPAELPKQLSAQFITKQQITADDAKQDSSQSTEVNKVEQVATENGAGTIKDQSAPAQAPAAATPPTPAAVEIDPPVAKRSKGKGIKHLLALIPSDIMIPMVVALLVLAAGNGIYFGYLAEPTVKASTSKGAATTSRKGTSSKKGATISAVDSADPLADPDLGSGSATSAPQVLYFKGKHEVNGVELEAEFISNRMRMFIKTLSGTTPAPPNLTAEQIVRKEKRLPWVTRFEVQDTIFEQPVTGAFNGTGTMRLYIDFNGARHRVVAPARIRAQASPDESSLVVMVASSQNWTGQEVAGLSIESITDTTFTFNANLNFSLAVNEASISAPNPEQPLVSDLASADASAPAPAGQPVTE